MRLRLLDLTAFGPFTGAELDFGDGRGLAVVRGPNEAGKSSALRALVNLLYGVPHRSEDTFLHAPGSLAVRGVLDFGPDGVLGATRYKRKKNDLVDDSGRAVDQDALTARMGGVDKAAFETLYGIDQERLTGGGRDILRAGGALGESLFAAASGVVNLRGILDGLHGDAEALYTDRGGAGKILNPQFTAYKDLRREQNQAATSTSRWRELSRRVRSLEQERARAQEGLDALARDKNRLARLLAAAAPARLVKDLGAALEVLGDAPLLPADFFEKRLEAVQGLENARREAAGAREALEAVAVRLDGLAVDQDIVAAGEAVAALFREAAVHEKARRDALGLVRERDAWLGRVRGHLAALGSDLPPERAGELQPTRAARAGITELVTRHAALDQARAGALRSVEQARDDLKAASAELEAAPQGADTAELAVLLKRAEGGDPEALWARERDALAAESEALAVDLAALGLWRGTLEDMAAAPAPGEATAQAFAARLAACDADLRAARGDLDRAEEEDADARAALDGAGAGGAAPTPGDVGRARETRDAGWALVRRRLRGKEPGEMELAMYLSGEDRPGDLAEAFEADMRGADELADALYGDAERVAARLQATARAARAAQRVDSARERLERAEDERRAVLEEWEDVWRPLGVEPRSPAEMEAWLKDWRTLRRRFADLGGTRARVARLRDEASALRRDLGRALERMGEAAPVAEAPLGDALALAREARERHEERRRAAADARRRREEASRRLDRERAELERAEENLRAWAGQWAEAVAPLGLGPQTLPAEAEAVLATLADLAEALAGVESMARRVRGIDEDFKAYAEAVAGLVERLAPDLDGMESLQAVDRLHARLERAREDARERDGLFKERKRQEDMLERAVARENECAGLLERLCAEAGCAEADGLAEAEARSRRRADLERDLATARERLAEQAAGGDAEALAAEALALDPDSAAADLGRMEAELADLGAERDRLNQDYGGARRDLEALDGTSRAAELAQEARGTAAAIQDGLDRYVRLRLAEAVVSREIERFRKANQGPVLAMAGDLFKRLTLESFAGLEADFDERGDPVIKGLRPTGERLGVEAMSDGTRDQLYLALRLAGLHRRLDHGPGMPFVVDDILVNFDDERARAALAALAELAGRTQVVFFTHHTHLLDLARQAVPADLLRELSL